MKIYDVSCPCCGHRNRNLYLEETEGTADYRRKPEADYGENIYLY